MGWLADRAADPIPATSSRSTSRTCCGHSAWISACSMAWDRRCSPGRSARWPASTRPTTSRSSSERSSTCGRRGIWPACCPRIGRCGSWGPSRSPLRRALPCTSNSACRPSTSGCRCCCWSPRRCKIIRGDRALSWVRGRPAARPGLPLFGLFRDVRGDRLRGAHRLRPTGSLESPGEQSARFCRRPRRSPCCSCCRWPCPCGSFDHREQAAGAPATLERDMIAFRPTPVGDRGTNPIDDPLSVAQRHGPDLSTPDSRLRG